MFVNALSVASFLVGQDALRMLRPVRVFRVSWRGRQRAEGRQQTAEGRGETGEGGGERGRGEGGGERGEGGGERGEAGEEARSAWDSLSVGVRTYKDTYKDTHKDTYKDTYKERRQGQHGTLFL